MTTKQTKSKVGSLEEISRNLFYAVKEPLNPSTKGFNSPSVYGVYKDNGGDCMGVVRDVYEILQPVDFVSSILDAVKGYENDLDLSKASYTEFRNGAVISVKIPVKRIEVKTKALGDVTDFFLDFKTAFDGRTSTNLSIFSKRLVCMNGMTISTKEAGKKFKHTKNANVRAKLYATGLVKTLRGLEVYQEVMNKLAEVELSDAQFQDLVTEITGYEILNPLEVANLHHRTKTTYTNLMESISLEVNRTGQTAFGLLQGITHFTNHNSLGKTTGEEYVSLDSGLDLNNKAQKVLYSLVD